MGHENILTTQGYIQLTQKDLMKFPTPLSMLINKKKEKNIYKLMDKMSKDMNNLKSIITSKNM